MKKILLLSAAILLICAFSFGTTTLISPTGNGGFESGSDFAANGWTVVNGAYNQFYVGNAPVVYAGTNCAFSGSSSTTWAGTANTNVNHFYRSISFPTDESSIILKFRYKITAAHPEHDYLNLWLTASTPSAGNHLISTLVGGTSTQLGGTYDAATIWTEVMIIIPGSYANTTANLVFSWSTNNTSPKAAVAIDNIELISKVPDPLNGFYAINNALPTSSPMVHNGTGNFNNFNDAINYLNSEGISASVVFNVAAGKTFNEIPPAITTTGTITNTITFQRSGAGNNPKITPIGTAGSEDAGIIISGSDYITFDGIDIDASSVVTVEYGYLVRNASSTDGAQYNTIKNVSIKLNKGNYSAGDNSSAIFQTAYYDGGGTEPTSANGANSHNKYYNFTISNALIGVYFIGDETYRDLDCEIGTSLCTNRNTISNIGPISGGNYSGRGMFIRNQEGIKIFNNDISSVAGAYDTYGIDFRNGYGTNNQIYCNKIQNISITASVTNNVYGITASYYQLYTGPYKVKIYNNFISNIYHTINLGSGGGSIIEAAGLYLSSENSLQSFDVDNNSISIGQGLAPQHSNACIEINHNTPVCSVHGNVFANFTNAQAGTDHKHFCIAVSDPSLGGVGSVFEYNDYYIANGQGVSGYIGQQMYNTPVNIITIDDWKSYTTGSLDETSFSINPVFSNNSSDLHASSAGLNAVPGFTTQAWITNDIDCEDRSLKSPSDVGADAFSLNNPVVITLAASSITTTGATLNGTINPNGLATTYYFDWGTTPGYGNTTTTASAGSGTSAIAVNADISSLISGTPYHFRLVATNSDGTSFGSDLQFTSAVDLPSVTTTIPTLITATTASSGGTVNTDGGGTVTARGVCWATTSNPTIANAYTSNGTGTGSFTSSITGLTASTPYHVRAYATNSAGTAYGSDLEFTTTEMPTLMVTPSNQNVTSVAGVTSFSVTSNSSWTAGSNQSWCIVTLSGTGNGIISADYTTNTSASPRVANITVTVTGLSPIIVTVTQDATPPEFLLTAQNIVQTSPTTLEFDAYLLDNNASSPFELATNQLGFLFNSGIYNGGSISASSIAGTSELSAAQVPTAAPSIVSSLTGYPNQTLLRLAGRTPPGAGSGSIISTVSPGTRIIRLKLTSTVPFAINSALNMVFTSSSATNPIYATRVNQYVGTVNTPLTVTPGYNANVLQNPLLNPPTLAVTPSNRDVTSVSGNTTFTVTSNTNWTAISNQTWCTVTSSGSGNGTITALYGENTTIAPRVAEITVTVTGLTPIIVTISQEGITNKVLNLSLLLQGLYNGSGTMHPAMDESGAHWGSDIADKITVELHDNSNYSNVIFTVSNAELHTDGTVTMMIPAIYNGSYYLTIKHRNSIETVSALPVSFAGNPVNYQFNLDTQAYGNNLGMMLDGWWVIFGGDVDQNGLIDTGDFMDVDNDSYNYQTGYLNSDTNGDGIIDTGDMILVDNNSANYVSSLHP